MKRQVSDFSIYNTCDLF